MKKTTSKLKKQNGAKPPVSDSKKMRCTKTLIHSSGSEDFTIDKKYNVIEKIPGGVVLKNNSGNMHTLNEDGWLAFFYYC